MTHILAYNLAPTHPRARKLKIDTTTRIWVVLLSAAHSWSIGGSVVAFVAAIVTMLVDNGGDEIMPGSVMTARGRAKD